MSLRSDLEALKRTQSKFKYDRALLAIAAGILLLAGAVPMAALLHSDELHVRMFGYIGLTLPWVILAVSFYRIERYKLNKRLQLMYEALLSAECREQSKR